MPTRDPAAALDVERARATVAAHCFPPFPAAPSPGRLGLEVESFPILLRGRGLRRRVCGLRLEHRDGGRDDQTVRLPLRSAQGPSLSGLLDELAGTRPDRLRPASAPDPAYPLADGGRLEFEPGGQLEHTTVAHATAADALDEATAVGGWLAGDFERAGVVLASTGIDLWHDVRDVPQQLTAPRYQAMAAYLANRGSVGTLMMRHTCALQINVDPGPPAETAERWLVANLAAPIATATFASSPVHGVVSARARAWQSLDPTRTGFPARLVDGSSNDPVTHLLDAALTADVLLVRMPGTAEPGRPGWSFADWMRDGHPSLGWPTVDDLTYHLTTLFHEVRPRGRLELRCVDALPARWRPVPVVLFAGLLGDPGARAAALAVLERHRRRLPTLWRRAARVGVADPALCALAVELWSFAFAGAQRLPIGYLALADLHRTERFLDRFTLRGRCPAHELRAVLDEDPLLALDWAIEPLPVAVPSKDGR